MFERHWKLRRDPFHGVDPPFVATPSHTEALARLVHAIEAGDRRILVRAGPGLGKTLLLGRALELARSPRRRIARANSPTDGAALMTALAEGLSGRVPTGVSRAVAWRALADAAQLCRLQELAVVLAVDDVQGLTSREDRLDLDRLMHVDSHPKARVSIVLVGRDESEADPMSDPWALTVRLVPLTRSEVGQYLAAKLASAGRDRPTFTPNAMTRLHALTAGIPRGLDRVASLALLAAAAQGREMVTPDIIEGVAADCAGAFA
jgi:MSHA biogenesis protein MshM